MMDFRRWTAYPMPITPSFFYLLYFLQPKGHIALYCKYNHDMVANCRMFLNQFLPSHLKLFQRTDSAFKELYYAIKCVSSWNRHSRLLFKSQMKVVCRCHRTELHILPLQVYGRRNLMKPAASQIYSWVYSLVSSLLVLSISIYITVYYHQVEIQDLLITIKNLST